MKIHICYQLLSRFYLCVIWRTSAFVVLTCWLRVDLFCVTTYLQYMMWIYWARIPTSQLLQTKCEPLQNQELRLKLFLWPYYDFPMVIHNSENFFFFFNQNYEIKKKKIEIMRFKSKLLDKKTEIVTFVVLPLKE